MFLFSARLCYNTDVKTGYSTSQEEGVTMKQTIITISREFGSGGHFIGEEVSKRLGIPFYDKNIIHRDIKPANILLLTTGGYKLTDFGMGRIIQDTNKR